MKKPLLYSIYAIVGLLLLTAWGASMIYVRIKAESETRRQIFADLAAAAQLTATSEKADPQLREYSKAQLYYFSSRHNVDFFSHELPVKDLGPVNEDILQGTFPFLPHADSPNSYYPTWK